MRTAQTMMITASTPVDKPDSVAVCPRVVDEAAVDAGVVDVTAVKGVGRESERLADTPETDSVTPTPAVCSALCNAVLAFEASPTLA